MLDIKGQQVDIGDKCLVSTKNNGLVLCTFSRESKTNFFFSDNRVERISKFIKNGYVGYNDLDKNTGLPWQPVYGSPNRNGFTTIVNYDTIKRVGKGTNGSNYNLKDVSNDKQSRVLKVDKDFEL